MGILKIESPQISSRGPVDQQVQEILRYLYRLTEELRYSMGSLDEENMVPAFREKIVAAGDAAVQIQELSEAQKAELDRYLELLGTVDNTVASVEEQYYLSDSETELSGGEWSLVMPERTEGKYIWRKTVSYLVSGKTEETEPVCLTGAKGEDATVLRIDSSRGTVFKNSQVSTVLTAVIYHGADRITTLAQLRQVYGVTAHLEWSWQRLNEEVFGVISADDARLSQGGFCLTISPEDVDVKTTFQCQLVI